MRDLARLLRHGLIAALGALACAVLPAGADEVQARGGARGLVIHDAGETLRDFCRTDELGRTWLELPGGAAFELVTAARDLAIPNAGSGEFHPFDPAEVRAALAAVRFPLEGIEADVFLLPYPRRGALESAAGPGLVLLSPGVWPLPAERQHAETIHELGHVVQKALMPDEDAAGWSAYRRLRGIEDAARFSASSPHADRPHEIFAEDFRWLFGDGLAKYSGSIENAALPLPDAVPGLERFVLALAGAAPGGATLAALPNPSRGAVEFVLGADRSEPLDVFDAAGRRVASLAAERAPGGTRWRWDGRDAVGRPLAEGVWFARVRGAAGPAIRVTRVP